MMFADELADDDPLFTDRLPRFPDLPQPEATLPETPWEFPWGPAVVFGFAFFVTALGATLLAVHRGLGAAVIASGALITGIKSHGWRD
jgi:hypothetical protein